MSVWKTGRTPSVHEALSILVCLYECTEMTSVSPDGSEEDSSPLTDFWAVLLTLEIKGLVIKIGGSFHSKGNLILAILN